MVLPARRLAALLLMLLAPASLRAEGLDLRMPAPVLSVERQVEDRGSYALPVGPFAGGGLPVRPVEGVVERSAWRLDAPGATLLDLLAPLRAQVQEQGFQVLLDCDARACGGFDFRFATEVLPEPAMHVDLGGFRFLSAVRGDTEALGLLVSRSGDTGFVQLIRVAATPVPEATAVAPEAEVGQVLEPPADAPGTEAEDSPAAPPPAAPPGTLAAQLDAGLPVALDDLVFASGSAELAEGDYASLKALAGWLAADPARAVILVGHTDASGALGANIALSKARAEAVRKALVGPFGANAGQVSAQGVGPLAPRAGNATDEGRRKNRRVEAVPALAP